jgi:hypothetical protein
MKCEVKGVEAGFTEVDGFFGIIKNVMPCTFSIDA